MKRSNCICILLAFACFFTACQNKGEFNVSEEYVKGFIADDSQPLSTALTKEYSLQELKDYFGEISLNESTTFDGNNDISFLSISAVNQEYPIECLRQSGYSVYKVTSGGFFYVFWIKTFNPFPNRDFSTESNDAIVYFTAYLSSLPKERDFDSIKEGISTAADVANIDPAFELVFSLSSKTPSYSLLDNGTIMEICYCWEGDFNSRRDLIVESKKIISKDSCPAKLASVLISDLP